MPRREKYKHSGKYNNSEKWSKQLTTAPHNRVAYQLESDIFIGLWIINDFLQIGRN